jgi:hypothetical protein
MVVVWGLEVGLLEVGRDMKILVNQETVNDIAKLMMHRLISREIGRDPSLVERAKVRTRILWRRITGRGLLMSSLSRRELWRPISSRQ